jgi:hypothetical protein
MIICTAMKPSFSLQTHLWALALSLLSSLYCCTAQYVELKAEIEINDWDGWFFFDKLGRWPGSEHPPSVFSGRSTERCVVGANTWMLETISENITLSYWFTGTNIIEHTLIARQTPDDLIKRASEISKLAMTSVPVGHRSTRIYESIDGNPGRSVRVADLMSFDVKAKACWLAFCSGPCLKREGRQIYPPSDLWKESWLVNWGWSDHTEVFPDGLGLPKIMTLVTTNNQCIFQYQVHASTNLLGWNLPLEFYGVQYLPTGTNAWKVALTLKGRVTAIGPAAEPSIPPEVMQAIEH